MCHGRSWTPMDLAAQRLRDKAWRKRCAARIEASCPWIVHVSSMVYTRPSVTDTVSVSVSLTVSVTQSDTVTVSQSMCESDSGGCKLPVSQCQWAPVSGATHTEWVTDTATEPGTGHSDSLRHWLTDWDSNTTLTDTWDSDSQSHSVRLSLRARAEWLTHSSDSERLTVTQRKGVYYANNRLKMLIALAQVNLLTKVRSSIKIILLMSIGLSRKLSFVKCQSITPTKYDHNRK